MCVWRFWNLFPADELSLLGYDVADVEDFYNQCDPGQSHSFLVVVVCHIICVFEQSIAFKLAGGLNATGASLKLMNKYHSVDLIWCLQGFFFALNVCLSIIIGFWEHLATWVLEYLSLLRFLYIAMQLILYKGTILNSSSYLILWLINTSLGSFIKQHQLKLAYNHVPFLFSYSHTNSFVFQLLSCGLFVFRLKFSCSFSCIGGFELHSFWQSVKVAIACIFVLVAFYD